MNKEQILEVIKSVLPEYEYNEKDEGMEVFHRKYGYNDCIEDIKQKAKDLYSIDI